MSAMCIVIESRRGKLAHAAADAALRKPNSFRFPDLDEVDVPRQWFNYDTQTLLLLLTMMNTFVPAHC